jgi:toluene monooxygenase system ferredoxin subunit
MLIDVLSKRDLWSGESRVVRAGLKRLLILSVDGEVFAYEDSCLHLGLSLEKASLQDGVLRCAHHGWTYDAKSGAGVNPRGVCLARVRVEVRADRIFVDVSEGPPA